MSVRNIQSTARNVQSTVRNAKSTATSAVRQVKGKLNRAPVFDPTLYVFLVLDGKEYKLTTFVTKLGQNIDRKGEPNSMVQGGLLYISLDDLPDENLNKWALTSGSGGYKNGEIQFRRTSSNMPLRIEFEGARCVDYEKKIGDGVLVYMTISAKELHFNGILHDNRW